MFSVQGLGLGFKVQGLGFRGYYTGNGEPNRKHGQLHEGIGFVWSLCTDYVL